MTDSALSSNPDALSQALASVPDTIASEAPATVQPEPVAIQAEPWAGVKVDWLIPITGMLLKLPYEQAAKYTKDDCWLITDDQIAIVNPAMENALRWVVWRMGAANTVSHPLIGFGVAMASITAAKWGMYQYHQKSVGAGLGANQSGTSRNQRNLQSPQQPHSSTPTATMRTNGRMEESEAASSSAASQEAAKATFSKSGFVLADE